MINAATDGPNAQKRRFFSHRVRESHVLALMSLAASCAPESASLPGGVDACTL
jgi:hypothetical protein